jgi:squalene cyclase
MIILSFSELVKTGRMMLREKKGKEIWDKKWGSKLFQKKKINKKLNKTTKMN